jgi:hypothetical protein
MFFYPLKVFADTALIHFDQVYFLCVSEFSRDAASIGDPNNQAPQPGFVRTLFIDRFPEPLVEPDRQNSFLAGGGVIMYVSALSAVGAIVILTGSKPALDGFAWLSEGIEREAAAAARFVDESRGAYSLIDFG